MQELKKPQDNQQREFEFLHAELPTGLTFSAIALMATYPGKKKAQYSECRKAYDAALRFLPGSGLAPDQEAEIKIRLEELKGELQLLGEAV
jgi:hypothetical protein